MKVPCYIKGAGRASLAVAGSALTLYVLWTAVLIPLEWPPLSLVMSYFWSSVATPDMYLALLATGARAFLAGLIGFTSALVLAILTGRTRLGWIMLFVLLMAAQKIPAIAMVHVFVSSRLGIGMPMTVSLAALVVMTFSWLILHHRAQTLDPREMFALRVTGLRGWRLACYGLFPHLGSAIGATLRLSFAISTVIVIVGEWQGTWGESLWARGLGVSISRSYDAIDSEARVLAICVWLGALGLLLDGLLQAAIAVIRKWTGVSLQR